MVFDRTLRDAEPLADFAVRESLQVAQREDLAALFGQGGHRRVDAGAQVLRVDLFDDGIVVGIVVGVSDALDPLLMVGAVVARMTVFVHVIDRLVVDRAQQVAVERLPGIERLAADPDVYENVLHDVLRPVSLQEETGVSHQRRVITAAHLVESLAAAVADRRREPGVVCRNGFHVYKDTQILRIRHPAPGFFTVLHKTTAPEHIAVFRRRSSQRMQGVSS